MKYISTYSLLIGICLTSGLSSSVFGEAEALRVIEEEAIPLTRFLRKETFDQRYPGQILKSNAELESGWYVIYQHEWLNYYFGPIPLKSTGEDYLKQLRSIVKEAVAERPDLENYRLELNYEPSASKPSANSKNTPLDSPAHSKNSGIFGFFRWIFGL